MGAALHLWPFLVLLAVYLVAVLCVAFEQAFTGFGEWWEPLAVPVALAAFALWRSRFVVVGLAVVGLLLWGVYR